MESFSIVLAQDAHAGLTEYLGRIGFDFDIGFFEVSYEKEGPQKISIANEPMDVGLIKVLMALEKILPTITDFEDQLTLSTLLNADYKDLLQFVHLRNEKVTTAALLLKRLWGIRGDLEGIGLTEKLRIEIILREWSL